MISLKLIKLELILTKYCQNYNYNSFWIPSLLSQGLKAAGMTKEKNMFYFTKYAESKFDILNKHKVFFTREQVEDAVNAPDKTNKKGKLLTAQKENIKVIYKKDGDVLKIITFFPIK